LLEIPPSAIWVAKNGGDPSAAKLRRKIFIYELPERIN
jgi:hypothetical protein